MPIQPVPQLIQLITQSTQPSLLIDINTSYVIEINTPFTNLLNINKKELLKSTFHDRMIKKATQLIEKDFIFLITRFFLLIEFSLLSQK